MSRAGPLTDYAGRSVLVTGHTGFKGSWLSLWLSTLGARVTGASDRVPDAPSLFELVGNAGRIDDRRVDVRDEAAVAALVAEVRPEIIFHLAAQAIVREALARPYETVAVNVMGTVAVLEAARRTRGVAAVVVVTSDKVYQNRAEPAAFTEDDRLGGHEPYGASKAAAEIITATYRHRPFHLSAGSVNIPRVATARAGNVIGGGDFGVDRLVPDVVRAIRDKRDVILRSPRAVRPWQHVLEPLSGYLALGLALASADAEAPAAVNFGPDPGEDRTVMAVVEAFLHQWGPNGTRVVVEEDVTGVETATLRVRSDLAREQLKWVPVWDTDQAIGHTAAWYRAWSDGAEDLASVALGMIEAYARDAAALGLPWARPPQ
jgi:CDP-glucose 4,6-dehydratase